MKNSSFIAVLLANTALWVNEYLSKKAARNLPQDLSHLAKYLIGQSGQKKEDIFRSTGLSRDYLYKVLRGEKKIKERDYILAVCLASHLDLFDTAIMLESYHLDPLSVDNERDVILIHAILDSLDVEGTNRMLRSSGWHTVRTSPKDPVSDHPVLRMSDLAVTNMEISYADEQWEIDTQALVRSNGTVITLNYYQNGLEKSIHYEGNAENQNDEMKQILTCYLDGLIWQEIRNRIENTGWQKDSIFRILPVEHDGKTTILEETYQGQMFYQLNREANGCTTYLKSKSESTEYFFLHFLTGSDDLYHALYGMYQTPFFTICGCDLEELDGADDRDIAVFLRMKRDMKLWRLQNGYLKPSVMYYLPNAPMEEDTAGWNLPAGIRGKSRTDQAYIRPENKAEKATPEKSFPAQEKQTYF